jgi:hypothetical protein
LKLLLTPLLAKQLKQLYDEMEQAYDLVANQLQLTCTGCSDNCCDSYFQHHTYLEWSYLWQGLYQLPSDQQRLILQKAAEYERRCESAQLRGEIPGVMCPLNESGRCILYTHRLMVCRTHGVPATMVRPDGKILRFPGCFRCQELVDRSYPDGREIPVVERTSLLRRMVVLEQKFLGGKRHLLPKVKMTIAAMVLAGPPTMVHCSDRQQGEVHGNSDRLIRE